MTPEERKVKNGMSDAQKLKRKAYRAAWYQKLTPEEKKARVAQAKVRYHARKGMGKVTEKAAGK